ncbi:Cytochrome c oxidase assembly protein cox20, mitochondrial [Pichia californica]|uniref:Cytochrome c oxidase assembly protein COX20, mitochondrial n=1 Tax=Pichia californica TaxID=460514 RepID=A0A9P7BEQ1_9ASCO|nr:Cytochrome c oxidase assembly protein cox20, mitochondrial [[Candida] californica]KAG0688111.1 Cytochrome c oxidase assembly protein cox20, mitochondrial [[Candida] californica]
MGWWPFNRGSSKDESLNSTNTTQQQQQPLFLDDVPAKYPEQSQIGSSSTSTPTSQQPQQVEGYSMSKEVKTFVSTLTPQHFYLSSLVQIPCFREAGLSGFSCFFVFSTVLYFYHRNLRKAVNWGFGGLLLGSIFGWESCNNQRRNSQMAVKLAQARFEKKHQTNNNSNSNDIDDDNNNKR